MTRKLTTAALAAGTMALGLLFAGPALASDRYQPERGHERADHGARGDHAIRHERRHVRHRRGRGHRVATGHHATNYYFATTFVDRPYAYGSRGNGYGYVADHARHCQPVSKHGYDSYGRPARIGGTMCFDRYGQGYVVPGSRYVISRY